MTSTPIQSPTSRREAYDSYLRLGRWTVDNSESRIARPLYDSPRRSILKGSQTPNRLPAPFFSSRERHQKLQERRVSFAPDADTSVRLFGEDEAADRTVTSPVPSNRGSSSLYDEISPLSARLDENTFLSRLSGSPSDRRKRRVDLFGSPPRESMRTKKPFDSSPSRSDRSHSASSFVDLRTDLTQYLSLEHQKGPRRLFDEDPPSGDNSQELAMQLTQEQLPHHDTITDTRWTSNSSQREPSEPSASQREPSEEPMQLTQEMATHRDTGQRPQLHLDNDQKEEEEEEMRITQQVNTYAPPASAMSPIRPAHDRLSGPMFSPVRSFYLHSPLNEQRFRSPLSARNLTGEHSLGSDYADRMMSLHGSENINILDEEFPQTYDSFVEESTPPPKNMSLSEFLQYAGITFMDGMTVEPRRRTSGFDPAQGPVTMVDQAIASVNVIPELDLYRPWCEELEDAILRNQKELLRIDEEMSLNNPQFFAEYLEGDVHFRNQMEAKFKLIKQLSHLKTKRDWYERRQDRIMKVNAILLSKLEELHKDQACLDVFESRLTVCVPRLLAFRDEISASLKEAQERETLYHQIDHDQLRELESEIEDQRVSIQEFRKEKDRVEAQKAQLEQKEADQQAQETELQLAIQQAEKTIKDNQCITEEDLVRARDHYNACAGAIHWKLENQNQTTINIKIDDDLDVVLDRDKLGRQEVDAVLIRMLESRDREFGPYAELLHGLQVMFSDTWDEREIMQEIAIYWNRVKMMRREIELVQRRFWAQVTALEAPDSQPEMRGVACSIVVFSYMGQTKFTLTLSVMPKDILAWPAFDFMDVKAKLEYGHVTQEELDHLIRQGLEKNGMVDLVNSLRNVLDKIQPPARTNGQ